MTLRSRFFLLAAFGIGLAVAGCQEQLTAPGSCPATCPGGTPVVHDTILDAIVGGDSTYLGYVVRGATTGGFRVSNGFHGITDYGVVRFIARADSVSVRDTLRSYTIDSVALSVTLLARDTTASGMLLELHRVPAGTDTSSTYGDVSPLIIAGTLLDSATIADSVRAGFTYRFVFDSTQLAQVAIPPGDSGILALAVAISGGTTTGIRLGGIGSGGGVPRFQTFVTVNVPDTTPAIRHQVVSRGPSATTYVSSGSTANDPDLLTVGTAVGARALVRFKFPEYLKDSALISRATLELTPESTVVGLSGDSAIVDIDALIADYGAKSPTSGLAGFRALTFGSADTVRVEVSTELKNWQRASLPHPPAFMLSLSPEGSSFTEPRFKSTRSASGRPRLHITYQLPFDFERP
jgi:hypothetical protein